MLFRLFTDGACQPNPGNGGWAYIIYPENQDKIVQSGYQKDTTNNRMEIMAALEGLKRVVALSNNSGICPQVTLYADSKYVLQSIESWMRNWGTNGWKRKDKKPVFNVDLWKQIYTLIYDDKKVSITSYVHIQKLYP